MYERERLTASHDVSTFDCGQAALDGWLRSAALTVERKGTARVFVWADDGAVVGYFAVAPHLVERGELPVRLGRGDPRQIPAVLIAKLALDRRLQGRGLGAALLHDALHIVALATAAAGGRYVVVDAIDDSAAAFYQRHGFRSCTRERRLVRRVGDIIETLKAAGRLE